MEKIRQKSGLKLPFYFRNKVSELWSICGGSNYRKVVFASIVSGIFVILIYIWLISVGQWTIWPETNDYYFQLASAFWHRQLNLLITPDPALLTLPDPYVYESRETIPYPWDVSLYKEKFYLYWGPVPAALLAIIRGFYRAHIGDNILVFTFITGAFVFSVILLLRIFNHIFNDLEIWAIIPGVLLLGLANPLLWIMNRPGIYEAAIASGQFFLMGGLLFGYLATEIEQRRIILLITTGIFWSLAIGSRVSLIGAIGFLSAMLVIHLFHKIRIKKQVWFNFFAISIPLIIGLFFLGLYNKLRFDSWFEFGHRYQLTDLNLNAIYGQVISFSNFYPNIYNYLINPFRTISVFPFIKAKGGGEYLFFNINSPQNYYTEEITGILLSFPYVLLAVIPVTFVIRELIVWKKKAFTQTNNAQNITWLAISLLGATFLAFSTILFYIYSTMRYLTDVIYLATLCSTLGLFIGLQYLKNTVWERSFIAFALLLTLASVIISILLAITSYAARFENFNPELFEFLTIFFTP
jgi:hypothetical protein